MPELEAQIDRALNPIRAELVALRHAKEPDLTRRIVLTVLLLVAGTLIVYMTFTIITRTIVSDAMVQVPIHALFACMVLFGCFVICICGSCD